MNKPVAAAFLSAMLALTACSQTGATSGSEAPESSAAPETTEAAPEPSETVPETTEAAPEVTTPAPEPVPTDEGIDATEGAIAFGETWVYEDGIEVIVTPVGPATTVDGAGAEATGGQYWIFDVVLTNGSDAIFDPTGFTESVQYGATGLQASRVFDVGNPELGSSFGFEGQILPGKQQTLRLGYAIPHTEVADVTMIVTPSFEHVDAIYTGAIG